MFEKYLKAENLNPEHIETAYKLLKQYCDKKSVDVLTFVSDSANIKPASEYIHKELSFAYRMILSKDRIEKLIFDNIDFIKNKAKELHSPLPKNK
jgi:hypothetical protein